MPLEFFVVDALYKSTFTYLLTYLLTYLRMMITTFPICLDDDHSLAKFCSRALS